MAENRLKKSQHLLQVLHTAKPALRKAILTTADKELIMSLCEFCINILNGNIVVERDVREKLRKFKSLMRKLSAYESKNDWKKKKRYLVQSGGGAFISTLLSAVLASIAGKFIGGLLTPSKNKV